MVLSSADVTNFKSKYGVIVIHINCDPSAAKDKSLPRNSYLIKCDNDTEVWYDIVMGFQSDIFNAYYDTFGNVMKAMNWTDGGNWSYNPEHFDDNEVPVSQMANDLLTTYKYGWKTSYYQNTHDMKTDEVEEDKPDLQNLL